MRITILATAALSIISITQASYILNIPMERGQGGALPDGSINMTPRTPGLPVENWQPVEPLYSEWVDIGNVSGCSNWTPDASTMLKDETFNQTAKDCLQYQTRTRQNREQETTTLAYRNVGEPVTIEQNVTASSSRTATGTAACSYSRYVTGTPNTFWMAGTSTATNAYLVYLNGVQIKTAGGYYTTSFILNGITYKIGTTVKDSFTNESGTHRYYEVCK